jgi:hypothetical protein
MPTGGLNTVRTTGSGQRVVGVCGEGWGYGFRGESEIAVRSVCRERNCEKWGRSEKVTTLRE